MVRKWVLKVAGAFVAIMLGVPLFFFVSATVRERDERTEIAPNVGRFVYAHDVQIYIEEVGDPSDPTIFILHGMAAWSGTWRERAAVLVEDGWHVVAVDMPPFGFSERPELRSYWRSDQAERLNALMDALETDSGIVLAHSYGSRAGFEFALRYPNRVRGIIVADPALDRIYNTTEVQATSTSGDFTLLSLAPLRNLLVSSTMTNPLLARTFLTKFMHRTEAASDAVLARYQMPSTLQKSTSDLGYWLVGFMGGVDVGMSSKAEAFKTLNMPVAIIWGREDTTTPLSQGEQLHALIASSSLTIIDGVGHMPHLEDPVAFDSALKDTLHSLR